jgi:uncharacterized repeat protein (TIGR02543 family)
VTFTATASAGYTFGAWSGDSTSSSAGLMFTIPAASASLTPNFLACYALTSVGTGGVVSFTPTSSGTCAAGKFVSGASVSLTATPSANYFFAGWTGAMASAANPLSFSMPAAVATVTPSFTACYFLTLFTAAGGTVTKTPQLCWLRGRTICGGRFDHSRGQPHYRLHVWRLEWRQQ